MVVWIDDGVSEGWRPTRFGGLLDPKIDFVPLNDDKPEITPFSEDGWHYYIYSPTTRQYTMLRKVGYGDPSIVFSVSIAFDPSKSPHYKVVYVWGFDNGFYDPMMDMDKQIEIYSSETGLWKDCGGLSIASQGTKFT
ncbi:hypothetical protein L1049_020206 [Liquidambar formosana]|uniref:Uncharacterized protein n=1 Tax=Liquidambar formosana TaxID=63359 RepID=A0AAP0S855_LIQFO